MPYVDTNNTPNTASPSPSGETFKVGGSAVQTAVIAGVFLLLGILASAIFFNSQPQGLTALEVETIVRSIVSEEMANANTNTANVALSLVDDDPSFGPADAPVTIVEFSDFYCGFCTRFATETLPLLRERYGENIRFVYRDMPIIAGQASIDAAVAGNCAFAQDKFWEFHDILFSNNGARSRDNYISFAQELGMNGETFTSCLDDTSLMNEITLDVIDGQSAGVNATPKFFINGKVISGAQAYETFVVVIDAELEKAGVSMPALDQTTQSES